MKRFLFTSVLILLASLVLMGCAKPAPENPLEDIQKQYANAEQYSVVLTDMKVNEDKSIPKHKYKIVGVRNGKTFEKTTGWQKVPYELYEKNQKNLNMAILSKKGSEINRTPHPPARR